MYRATIIRGGKWKDNIYIENKEYGDFTGLKDAVEWIVREYPELRGGWGIITITIKEVVL